MNSEREEPSKADLVRMVNQFLLQNGLPVTAAALQKECEKLLGKNKASNDGGGRRTAREGATKGEGGGQGGGGGGRQIAGKCLADWLHRKEQQERRMPSPNEQKEQKSPPPPPRPSSPTDQPQQHLGAISPRKMPSMPPPHSSRKEGGGSQSTRNPRRRQMLPPNGKSGGNSQSARIAGGRTSHRTNSQQRGGEKSTAGTDTEDGGGRAATPFSVFIAAEEQHQMRNKGGGKTLLKKAESMGSIPSTTTTAAAAAPSSIPPDPVQARPAVIEKNGADECALVGEEELAESRWLCAHLDLGIVGQTLLRAGSAPGREIALLVQAIRHQLTKIGTLADGEANLRVFAAKDLLQLRSRKQSLASLLLADQSAIPEFKEQFTRLLNAFASFRAGRDYLLSVGQGRQLLYETTMALKGRRLVGHSVEQLLAALQKLSIRPAAQKELLLNGMLEWLALQLVQPKLSAAQLEFGTALLHNLAVNHQMAQSGLLRHKDQLLAAMYWLLSSSRNAQVLNNICGTLYILLGHGRIRQCARERGDLERAIGDRMQREQQQQQRPEHQRQLLALSQILRGELAPERRKPSASNDDNQDSFPDYLEAEIDSTDPLVPSLSEHFGQALLAQKFLLPDATFPPRRLQHIQYAAIEEDQESVPGVVPVPHQRSRPPPPQNQPNSHQSRPPPKSGVNPRPQHNFTSPQRKYRLGAKENGGPGAGGSKSAPPKDIGSSLLLCRQVHFERTSSMSSHSTFVVENNCRRPLLATNGFASVVASLKANSASTLGSSHRTAAAAGTQQRKRAGERATEKLESNSSSEALTIEENAVVEEKAEENGKKSPAECANRPAVGIGMPEVVQKLSQRQNRQQTTSGEVGMVKRPPAEIAKMFSSKLRTQREKWPRRESSNLLMMTPSPTLGREEAAKEELARSATFGGTSERENEGGGEVGEQTYDEYIAIFAARPKLNRTPPEFDE